MTYEEAVAKGLSPIFIAEPGEKLTPFSEISYDELNKAIDIAIPMELLKELVTKDIGYTGSLKE